MADWIFDGTNKIIKEPGSGPGDTSYDGGREIYSAWKRWIQSGNGQYDQAFLIEGGTPIGATGLFTGSTFILTNGWKLQGGDWDHQALVQMNLYSDDGVVTVANPSYNANIFVSASVAAQGVSTGGGSAPTASEVADAVWDEILSGHATAGSAGDALANVSAGASPEQIADAVWDEAVSEHSGSDSFAGYIQNGLQLNIVTDLDSEVKKELEKVEKRLKGVLLNKIKQLGLR